jgi:hypothetical protein
MITYVLWAIYESFEENSDYSTSGLRVIFRT